MPMQRPMMHELAEPHAMVAPLGHDQVEVDLPAIQLRTSKKINGRSHNSMGQPATCTNPRTMQKCNMKSH